jgi:hypothetical protein
VKQRPLYRLVAIKVLPEHTASDLDSRARFEREARLMAFARNSPDILTLGRRPVVESVAQMHLIFIPLFALTALVLDILKTTVAVLVALWIASRRRWFR